jgi:hypothetical protein
VELYRHARGIFDNDDAIDHWEEQGGRRGEFYEVSRKLDLALGRHPWEEDLFDTIGEDAPPHWLTDHHKQSWWTAHAIRVELDRLL